LAGARQNWIRDCMDRRDEAAMALFSGANTALFAHPVSEF
jgi:hypothetical protein